MKGGRREGSKGAVKRKEGRGGGEGGEGGRSHEEKKG